MTKIVSPLNDAVLAAFGVRNALAGSPLSPVESLPFFATQTVFVSGTPPPLLAMPPVTPPPLARIDQFVPPRERSCTPPKLLLTTRFVRRVSMRSPLAG